MSSDSPLPSDHTDTEESRSLELARSVQAELAEALNSLEGKPINGALDRFIGFSAKLMNCAGEGYLLLRENRRVNSSKLLIRPMIEVMFRLRAVQREPSVFYRIAYTERLKRRRWLRGVATRAKVKFDEAEEAAAWEVFAEHCESKWPGCRIDAEINVFKIAKAAGLEDYYGSHYGLYCNFTHAALEAILGHLDALSDPEDNRTAALCMFAVIDAVTTIGASSPNFKALKSRIEADPRLPTASR